jgi:pilus assembly protein CpaE
MQPEVLKVSILQGTGVANQALQDLVESQPQVQMICRGRDYEDFVRQQQAKGSDLVVVYLDGEPSLPTWLGNLTTHLPQSAVVLCSSRLEPEYLLQAMRMGVREVLPLPLREEELTSVLARVRASRKRLSEVAAPPGKIIVVSGNKGGAGATTVAVNLALALAEAQGERVLLVDLGRPFPDVGNFLDRDPTHTIFDLIQNQADLDLAFLEKIIQPYERNLHIIHGISDFQDQDSVQLDGLKKIFALLKPQYRWIVVDLSHWLDDLFLQVIHEADLVLMLTELTVPDLRNLGHLWPILRQWQRVQEKVKIVVNRFQKGNGLGLGSLEQVLKEKPFFTLPNDFKQVNEAINRGIPLGKMAPNSKLWKSLVELGNLVMGPRQGLDDTASRPRRRFWVF